MIIEKAMCVTDHDRTKPLLHTGEGEPECISERTGKLYI